MITPTHYMLLSAALFIIGVAGVMMRRNIIIIFMSIELILNAVNINLVAFSNQLQNVIGQVFAVFVIAAIGAAILGLISLLSGGSENLSVLLQKMAEIIETGRSRLPPWMLSSLPEEPTELRAAAVAWLRENAGMLRSIGQDVWRALIHILFGLVIGGMVAVSREVGATEHGPLVHALTTRARLLASAFRSVVFAQVRISALNTALTAVYLLGIVPWMGVHLPLTKTMIAVTFVAGLLPVLGNLISNTVIVVVSLSVSPIVAASSLAFLVVIHKLEYFVNARVMGGQIHARAWELLVAMLIMDAVFGIPGVIAAPIFYAYLKNELSAQKLI